jgi:hypothetical protein
MIAHDPKDIKPQDEPPSEEVNIHDAGDHDSDKSQLAFQEIQENQQCFSQDSFGGTSQISSIKGKISKSQPNPES